MAWKPSKWRSPSGPSRFGHPRIEEMTIAACGPGCGCAKAKRPEWARINRAQFACEHIYKQQIAEVLKQIGLR